jgi:subtilisin family serine protease
MKTTGLYIVCFVFVCAQFLSAQQLIVRQQDAMQAFPAASRVTLVMENGKVTTTSIGSDNDLVRYIIEVTPPSMSAQQSLNKTVSSTASSLRSAVRSRLDGATFSVQTLREYSEAINGFCVRTERKNYSVLKNLPGISSVVEDINVSVSPIDVVSTVSVPQPELKSTATGKGIKVGIIDTGIDYLHESLGGGFGAAYKVCGGYDFVNNDADPRDDNGHGTHVAGIIAGNSATISGMAVNASLYSYKALDASGNGYASDIIAAIDRAIIDGVNVINLSFGTADGDPDDILSQAADRAAASGIIVVAAAGNGGDFGKIGSPGAARKVLTVGAVDSKNVIASFSSMGPTQKNFGIKPDVVAPGVSILSSKMGGGYVAMSGTSMSSPYVAGVAAALSELYPTWNAAQIRNAIIESAQRLPSTASFFTAGSGSVNPLGAARLQTVVYPGSISLGFNTGSTGAWAKRETLFVANVGSVAQKYTLSSASSSSAVTILLQPSVITVAPNQQAMVFADFQAANSLLADNLAISDGYTGTITAVSALDTVRVPYTFFKGTMLQLQFSEAPCQVLIHNRKNKSYSYKPKSNNLSIVVPADTYDILSMFYPSTYVVRENVPTAGIVQLTIKSDEAKNSITLSPIDETGSPIAVGQAHQVFNSIEALVHIGSGVGWATPDCGPYQAAQSKNIVSISDVSSHYVFGYSLNILKDNTSTYTYDAVLDAGIASTVAITYAPAEAKLLDVRYDVDTVKTHSVFPVVYSGIIFDGKLMQETYYDGTSESLRYPFAQKSVFFNHPSPSFPVYHSREAYKY